jgi:hypothetical protein
MEGPMLKLTGLKCSAATMIAKQYFGVMLDGNGDVIVCAGQGVRGIGILLNKPAAGEACEIAALGQVPFSAAVLVAGAAAMTVEAGGQMMPAAAGDYVWGFCQIGVALINEQGTMILTPQGVL